MLSSGGTVDTATALFICLKSSSITQCSSHTSRIDKIQGESKQVPKHLQVCHIFISLKKHTQAQQGLIQFHDLPKRLQVIPQPVDLSFVCKRTDLSQPKSRLFHPRAGLRVTLPEELHVFQSCTNCWVSSFLRSFCARKMGPNMGP